MNDRKMNRKTDDLTEGKQNENSAELVSNETDAESEMEKRKEAISRMLKAAKDAASGIGEYYTYEDIFGKKI